METLYNGIILPDEWPPKNIDGVLDQPMPIPYLENKPEIIPIDVGRQLFVDDFLIAKTNLKKKYHKAKKFEGNPVLYPKTSWEKEEALPVACPKSGGVWWDEQDKIFKMWYEAGWLHQLAYAVSKDGINWERPSLDIEPGSNKILVYGSHLPENQDVLGNDSPMYFRPDSNTVIMDKDCEDKSQRYKMFMRNPGGAYPGIVMTSGDGIHWENIQFTSAVFDRSTIFYNPFRKKWVYSIRWTTETNAFQEGWARTRRYREHDHFLEGATWTEDEAVNWLSTDALDLPNPYIGMKPQLYNVDAVAYESIMLGMFQIMYGPENNVCEKTGVPKITELMPMYSRDGFHWSRPNRETFINASMVDGAWDRGYVQSVGGVCVIAGDELWFYYAAFGGDKTNANKEWYKNGMYANGATGLAKLRRDGFVSVSAEDGEGVLLTEKLTFSKKSQLFVNINGALSIRILDGSDTLLAESEPFETDSTKAKVTWKNGFCLSDVCEKPIRLEFNLKKGELYSFWVSATVDGESGGYKAAGEVSF